MKKILLFLLGLGVTGSLLAGCLSLGSQSPPVATAPAPNIDVNNIMPNGAADSGMAALISVLLFAIIVIIGIGMIAGLVLVGVLWWNERRRRTDAEGILSYVKGDPVPPSIEMTARRLGYPSLTVLRDSERR